MDGEENFRAGLVRLTCDRPTLGVGIRSEIKWYARGTVALVLAEIKSCQVVLLPDGAVRLVVAPGWTPFEGM